MNDLYKLGVIVGIMVVYAFITIGLGAFLASINDEGDMGMAFFIAWMIGLVAFLVLAVFTLQKFGLWV